MRPRPGMMRELQGATILGIEGTNKWTSGARSSAKRSGDDRMRSRITAFGGHEPFRWSRDLRSDLASCLRYRQQVRSLGVGVLAHSRLEEPRHGCRIAGATITRGDL